MLDLDDLGVGENKGDEKKVHQLTPPSERFVGQLGTQTQRREMVLPVSKEKIMLVSQEFDPDELTVTHLNKRMQSLLSADDPNVIHLKRKIESEGQLEPILVRFVDGRPEAVYGSRRRFVISLINKERKEVGDSPLKINAWTHANIPDVDAQRLAASENEDKEKISPYEEGVYLKSLRDSKDLDTAAISVLENLGEKTVRDRLIIADIEIEFVNMLPSPSLVTQQSGKTFAALVNKTPIAKRKKFLCEFNGTTFEAMKDLVSEFKAYTTPKAKKEKGFEVKKGGKIKATMKPNRDDKTKFKVDLYDMDEDQIEIVKMFLEDLSK